MTHTHDFSEVISDDQDGLDRRCQCGARLWEPQQWRTDSRRAAEIVLSFSGGNVVKRGRRLVFERTDHTRDFDGSDGGPLPRP